MPGCEANTQHLESIAMKILVIGQGGREHALVKALARSPKVSEIHILPGNDGMSREAMCHNMDWRNTGAVIDLCLRTEIDYVFIGPEDPLVAGLADRLRERGILCVGPNQNAALLEGSKIAAKTFMEEAGVPTSAFAIVESVAAVEAAIDQFTPPYVLKADGLAAGKGVFICKTKQELLTAAHDLFEKKTLGEAGSRALLEQFQPGWELSYLVLTNGQEWTSLPVAQDHKRLSDDDEGPNTGGMGTLAPLPLDADLKACIEEAVVKPTVRHLGKRGDVYRGVIFIGLMITKDGPTVLEYNTRFGDPETQVILPLLEGDWAQVFFELARGVVTPLTWKALHACCVVLAAEGYPDNVVKGTRIEGDLSAEGPSSYFIHAGTKKTEQSGWVVNGGRTIGAVGVGGNANEAIRLAYEQAKKVFWQGMQYRRDIGKRWITSSSERQEH